MRLLCSILLFWIVQNLNAQELSSYRIISSNLGSAGSSQTVQTQHGIYKISQSIGQSSVIGTHHRQGYYLRQGYQQPTTRIKAVRDLDIQLRAKVYPNPFKQTLYINFRDVTRNDISVRIFNLESRLIYNQEFLPTQQVQLQINNIAVGTYLLRVSAGNKQFNTKLIKI